MTIMKHFLPALLIILGFTQAFAFETQSRSSYRWGKAKPAQKSSQCGTMNEKACEAFHLINEARQERGLPALSALSRCTQAAQEHAENMAKEGFFSHDAPYETWRQRMERYQLSGSAVAENIAMTSNGPEDAVERWIDSPGHYRNLVGAKYHSAGMGYADGHYVQCFSSRIGRFLE